MKKLLFLCGIFLVISCNKDVTITRSFCYWKTDLYINGEDDDEIDTLQIKHMYVRFFDVSWSSFEKQPRPVASLNGWFRNNNRMAITPSVYITNDVLIQADKQQLDVLALNIGKRINQILNKHEEDAAEQAVNRYPIDTKDKEQCLKDEIAIFKNNIKDILIDCDWTVKSKGNYFYLLRQLKKQLPYYKLSATIRLWQYRDYKLAGIPPVDKGLLMCYNLSSPEKYDNTNSIGTSRELKQYINHNDYALKLDVALPIFSWSVVFRQGRFKGILSDYYPYLYNGQDTLNFKKMGENRYSFKNDLVINQTYYRNGDEIRVEKISDAEMKEMIGIIKNNVDTNGSRITFFSWDQKYINDYGINTISGYYSLFER